MTNPGVATAAPKPSTTTADSTVTYDSGTSRTTDDSGPLDSPPGCRLELNSASSSQSGPPRRGRRLIPSAP